MCTQINIKSSFRTFFFAILILLVLIAMGCSGGGGSSSTSSGGTGGTAAKATISGTLLSSSSTSGSSLFKNLKKSASATTSLPVSGANVLCFDLDSVSTAAAGIATTNSSGAWSMDVSEGHYICYGIYIDLATLTIKTARMDDITASSGESVPVGEATVESDTTSPSIISVLSDSVADTSLADGDPDPLYQITNILPTQALSIIFSEAMNTSTMAAGTGVILKDSAGNTVPTTLTFNGQGTEFRYTPNTALTAGNSYTLYITDKVKDLSNNGLNDPDSDHVTAIAEITVTASVEAFSYLSSSPKDSDTGVSTYKDLSITFNRPVDFVSFKDHASLSPLITGRLEPSGDGVTFFHSTPLTANTEYTLTIGADVEDLAGNKLGTAKKIKFTTGSGISSSDVSKFVKGGGTTDDLLAIIANITKAELALDNQDIVTFASFFAPSFTMKDEECVFNPNPGTGTAGGGNTAPRVAYQTNPPQGGGTPAPPGEVCTTTTLNLNEFLDQMKKDLIEQRNMAKGFGEVQRILLTGADNVSKMSVEHFNSDFDGDRNAIGKDLYVGWPNRIEGLNFVNSDVEVQDPNSPEGTRHENVTYRLKGTCRKLEGTSDSAGAGEVLASYHHWDETTQRDEMLIRICPVEDGDADGVNSWGNDDELYPADWDGPRDPRDDNDQDCGPGVFDCQNEDGIISFKDTNSNGIPDQAKRYYETFDQETGMRVPHEQDITNQLSGLTVAAAMKYAADNNLDIEGVDNDGDSQIFTWLNEDGSTGGFIDRHVNEDWPNGTDDDGDCDSDKDGIADRPNSVCVDEDGDGIGNNPQPVDTDDDPTNDPMPHSDWNLANKADVTSSDEFWAETFLVNESALAPSGTTHWTDDNGNHYFEIPGPKGWPYPYAAGNDGIPWSGDEFDQYNGSGTSLDTHMFAWADVSILGKVYFRNDNKGNDTFLDNDRNVYVDLTAAGIVDANGNILDGNGNISTSPANPANRNRVSNTEKPSAVFRWDGSGHLSNQNGSSIDWQYVRPLMDHIDYNADGDWNVGTNPTAGLRRVPHDSATGLVMATNAYLALGWDTWRVSNDFQHIDPVNCADTTASGCHTWDVEADWARMEGDDDGDGLFNEDGLYSSYFNTDGSLKQCTGSSDYPCLTRDSTTGKLVLHRKDGTTTMAIDISDGIDNNGDGNVDEEEPFDDDGDGQMDEDPAGDPNDADGNGDTTAPYDDDDDGRKDEDPVSYERDRIDDHGQWAKIFQDTTDAVVDTFYLVTHTGLTVSDLVIDDPGTKATAIIDILNTETWLPHNPWGDDFNRDGKPDDVNSWTETMVFNMEKFSTKWLITSITPVDSLNDYKQQLESGDIKQFGGQVVRIKMISPIGTPESGPAANQTTTPTFVWDDSSVSGTIGSYLLHIEQITEAVASGGGAPTSVMMIAIAANGVTTDSATHTRSFKLGSGGSDITADVLDTFSDDPHFPFTTALTVLEDGKAYAWGVLAFKESLSDLQAAFAEGKPEPVGDSFEPTGFATTDLPAFLAQSFSGSKRKSGVLTKVLKGNIEYTAIPSNIAPNFYGKTTDTGRNHSVPGSIDPRLHK